MEREKKSKQEAEVWAILLGLFVWLFFDSFFYGVMAGLAAYFLIQRDEKEEEN